MPLGVVSLQPACHVVGFPKYDAKPNTRKDFLAFPFLTWRKIYPRTHFNHPCAKPQIFKEEIHKTKVPKEL